jgi:hypothetical protein
MLQGMHGDGDYLEIPGDFLQADVPDWEPLRHAVGDELLGWFKWMGEIELDDASRLHVYRHVRSREYLHLRADGRAYVYIPPPDYGTYRQISLARAMEVTFETLWDDQTISPDHRRAARAVIDRASAAPP